MLNPKQNCHILYKHIYKNPRADTYFHSHVTYIMLVQLLYLFLMTGFPTKESAPSFIFLVNFFLFVDYIMSTDNDTTPALTPSPDQPPSPSPPVITTTEAHAEDPSAKTPSTDVNEETAAPQEPSNVNFEQERTFFETNKDNLKNKIASLQSELEEERKLADTLANKDAADDAELAKIRQFLETNSEEVNSLHDEVKKINDALKELVKNNKSKQEELKAQSVEYASLVNSDQARHLAGKIKDIRTFIGQLEDFLVKEGVQGPKSPQ